MSELSKKSTVYFEPKIHQALRVKAASTNLSVSELVNEAIRASLSEDQHDLQAFKDRAAEPTMSYEALLDDLKEKGQAQAHFSP